MSLILSGTDGLSDVDGTAATPAIRGTDANTGIFFPAADTIAFAEGGAEVARFDSSGNLGIGTTSPAVKLDVVGAMNVSGNVNIGTSANGGQVMTTLQGYSPNSTNGSYGNLLFSANGNYTGGASRFLLTNAFNATDFAIISSVNSTTTPTLDSGGAVSSGQVAFSLKAGGNAAFAGNIGIGGATPTTSGTGITFPATQSASSNANTLDDYEEGDIVGLTDGSGAGLSITFTNPKYTKIGRLVYVTIDIITYPTTANTAAAIISGLPFTNTAGNVASSALVGTNANANRALVVGSTATVFFYATTTAAQALNSQLSTAVIYGFSAVYQTS